MNTQTFKINDNGNIVEAELLERTTFNDRDIAFYTINGNSDMVDIYASYIIKDNEGYETLQDITDEETLIWAFDYINELAEMGE